MDFYSNDPKADTINRVRGEISEVRSVMVDNIDKARHGEIVLQVSKQLLAVTICCAPC
jgi:vesicle-associated membrane protein 7